MDKSRVAQIGDLVRHIDAHGIAYHGVVVEQSFSGTCRVLCIGHRHSTWFSPGTLEVIGERR